MESDDCDADGRTLEGILHIGLETTVPHAGAGRQDAAVQASGAGASRGWRLMPGWQSQVSAVASSIGSMLNTAGTQVDGLTVHLCLPRGHAGATASAQPQRNCAGGGGGGVDCTCSCVTLRVAQLRYVDCSPPQTGEADASVESAANADGGCQDVDKTLAWDGLTVHVSERCQCRAECTTHGCRKTSAAPGSGEQARSAASAGSASPAAPALHKCSSAGHAANAVHEHADAEDAFFECADHADDSEDDLESSADASQPGAAQEALSGAVVTTTVQPGVLVLTGAGTSGFSGKAQLSLRFEPAAATQPQRLSKASINVSSSAGITVPLATATLSQIFVVVQRARASLQRIVASREPAAVPLTASVLQSLRPAHGLREVATLTADEGHRCV